MISWYFFLVASWLQMDVQSPLYLIAVGSTAKPEIRPSSLMSPTTNSVFLGNVSTRTKLLLQADVLHLETWRDSWMIAGRSSSLNLGKKFWASDGDRTRNLLMAGEMGRSCSEVRRLRVWFQSGAQKSFFWDLRLTNIRQSSILDTIDRNQLSRCDWSWVPCDDFELLFVSWKHRFF